MNTVTRPKRGARFVIIETGEEISLNRIKENGEYFMTFDNGNFESFWPDELKPVIRQRTAIASKAISSDKKQNKSSRIDFFNEVAKDMPYNCMNCNLPLYALSKWAKRCVSAHCLPKSSFPSIAENKDNIVFMGVDLIAGVCNCHTKFDYSVENRVKMPIYNLVLVRYKKLKPLLTDAEIISANKYLGITTDVYDLQEIDLKNIAEKGCSNNG